MGALFSEKPTIKFYPETSMCCNLPLHVRKTCYKTVITLALGEFYVRETVFECTQCKNIYTSEELKKIVTPWCNIGYDLLVYVGKSLFLKYRNEKEMQGKLKKKGIKISLSGIKYLAKRFIVYLALAHHQSRALLKEAMQRSGGYVLHIDGTCEGESPHLMSVLDGISEIVLGNVKVPSESSEKIIPFLTKIKESFGPPLAMVHDMGKGILKALEKVFKGIADFICHYHFLRDIGKDLLGKDNDTIRNRLKHHGIQGLLRKKVLKLKKNIDKHPWLIDSMIKSLENGRIEQSAFEQAPVFAAYTMIQWALDGKKQGNGYGFPFDRPYLFFYQRLQTVYAKCKKLQAMKLGDEIKDNKSFLKICSLLQDTLTDKILQTAAVQMQEKAFVFERLRDAMRIAQPAQTKGLNDNGEDVDIKTIEKRVKDFRHWLVNDNCYLKNNNYHKMIEQLDHYWEKLFADPITVDTLHGKVTIQPQRTNNLLERFFRDIKRGYRKKSGLNSMCKTLKAMLADTPLVRNLENPEYLNIILNGNATLEERFAEIDTKIVREELRKSQEDSEKIPGKIRKIIKKPKLPEALVELFAKQQKS